VTVDLSVFGSSLDFCAWRVDWYAMEMWLCKIGLLACAADERKAVGMHRLGPANVIW
jgi:hypothetical protein